MKSILLERFLACILVAALLAGCDASKLLPGAAASSAAAAPRNVVHDGVFVDVPEASPLRKSLQVATVETVSIETPISAPGTIEAFPEKLVKITAPLAGRIVKLHRSLGDRVKAGEALFTLDSADLSAAYGDSTKTASALRQARQDLDRQKNLFDEGIASRKDYEASQLAYRAAESDARVSAAKLAQLGASNPQSPREYQLRSPIAGQVLEISAAQGGYANDVNAPVMTIADLSTVYMSGNVSEKDIAAVFVGQKARIVLNAYPNAPVEGKVKYLGGVLDTETRTVKVGVVIDNRDGRFRPGMFAKVVFSGASRPAVVVSPAAIVQSGLYSRVFVEKTPYHYEPRIVTVGGTVGSGDAQRIEITTGLQAGDKVVVKEGVLLND